ncbi:MAG: SPFH/Band 7/PHB domain protein [Anaerolineales bacterium]|nr:SPFH/Band 7/PHB domain protein [Anaerolineales bacterium]
MPSSISALCIPGTLLLLLLAVAGSAIRIVQEYERMVIFRLGHCIGAKGPGVVLLLPFVDKGERVDLRERVREVPHQTSITMDNAPIAIDFIWYFKVVDSVQSVLQVKSFEAAAEGMAVTTLRSVIGGIPLDDVLSQRDHINQVLRVKLDEVTERWGVKVTNVEIREIIPPKEVQDAMNRQMTAERIRRANIIESTGRRDAEINIADGEKQAEILRAEGGKQAEILRAEGARQAQLLRAQGYSASLKEIFSEAGSIDQNTMTLQYFETLKTMSTNEATKFFFPLEITNLVKNFGIQDKEE